MEKKTKAFEMADVNIIEVVAFCIGTLILATQSAIEGN
jgi:hypothetical protein